MCFFENVMLYSIALVKSLSLFFFCMRVSVLVERYEFFYISEKHIISCKVQSVFNEFCNE